MTSVRLWGAPENLRNFSAMREFQELTNLSTFGLFGFGTVDIPTPEQMPALNWFWMTSLPEMLAKAAKQLWKSKLDDPFWDWGGAQHILATAAKRQPAHTARTRTQLMKLAAEPCKDAQALESVAADIQTFNKIAFIETEKRDEIYMALCDILDTLPDSTLLKDALLGEV